MVNGSGLARTVEDADILARLDVPEGTEVQVIKEVPAVVTHPETGEKGEVGTAYIHDDGEVSIKYSKDAPEWALDYVKSTAQEVGYSLGPLFKEDENGPA